MTPVPPAEDTADDEKTVISLGWKISGSPINRVASVSNYCSCIPPVTIVFPYDKNGRKNHRHSPVTLSAVRNNTWGTARGDSRTHKHILTAQRTNPTRKFKRDAKVVWTKTGIGIHDEDHWVFFNCYHFFPNFSPVLAVKDKPRLLKCYFVAVWNVFKRKERNKCLNKTRGNVILYVIVVTCYR